MVDLLQNWEEMDVVDIETEELLIYRRTLQNTVGRHLKAYRTERVRLADVEREIEKR